MPLPVSPRPSFRRRSLALLLAGGSLAAQAAPETLDRSFGTDGLSTLAGAAGADVSQGLGTDPQRIYLLSNGNTVTRLLPDGTLDPSFGTGGRVTLNVTRITPAPPPVDPEAPPAEPVSTPIAFNTVAVDPAGNLMLAGSDGDDIVIARYLNTGALDTRFGPGASPGFATLPTPGAGEAFGLRFSDQRILVAGVDRHDDGIGTDADLLVARLNFDGSPDGGFGAGGVTLIDAGTRCDRGVTLTPDTGGALLISGDTADGDCGDSDLLLARVSNNGIPDSQFASGGLLRLDLVRDQADRAGPVVVQDSGRYAFSALSTNIASGATSLVVGRVTRAGRLDLGFDGDGLARGLLPAITDFTPNGELAIQSGGGLLLAGDLASGDIGVARLQGSTQLIAVDDPVVNPPMTDTGGSRLRTSGSGALGLWSLLVLGAAAGLRRLQRHRRH